MFKTEAGSEDGPDEPMKTGGVSDLLHPGPIYRPPKISGSGVWLVKGLACWKEGQMCPITTWCPCEPVLAPGGPAPKEQAIAE